MLSSQPLGRLGGGLCILGSAIILLGAAAISGVGGVLAQPGSQITVPPVPDPVAVTVDASSTALLIADVNSAACPDTPPCAVTQPIATLLARARAAGATVVYSTYDAAVLPPTEDAPQPGEIVLVRPHSGPIWEGMAGILQAKNIQTIVFVGNSLNQVIIYGSYELAARYGFTIVAPEDGTVAATDYLTASTRYQLLHLGNGINNPDNAPLQKNAVTLTRSDLVSFQ